MDIKLINMPFADMAIPSIGLTQLKSIADNALHDKINVDIHYLNHDFAEYLTLDVYRFISLGGQSNNSGFGDWIFRQAAFPECSDNTEDYLLRYGQLIGGNFLQKNGLLIQSKRQDLDVFLDKLIDKYDLANAEVVGFTSMFMQNVANLAMARKIKEKNKDVIIVMGGANCESPMGEEIVRSFEVIDYVFSGTALVSFPKFLNCIMTGNRSETNTISGVFSKVNTLSKHKQKAKILVKESGEVETVGPIGEELSLNEYVPLDYDSFLESFDTYFSSSSEEPQLLFETSRGCWWGARAHCTFCGLNGGGMAYRAMNNEGAIDMINGLIKRYGDRVNYFSCVDNIIPREFIEGVFPFIEKKEGIRIFYEVRADLNSKEMEILSNAGVVEMQPGIESLSTSTLKLMKKGTTSFNNINFLQRTVLYSVDPVWNLLIGFPGEKEDVYEKYCNDIPSLYHLPAPSGVFPVRFDRYSPYYTEAVKYQLDLSPLDYYSYTYPNASDSLSEMAYYFGDQNYDADYIRTTAKWIGKLESHVRDWNQQWKEIDENSFPKLYFSTESDLVIDQRTNETKHISLKPLEKDVLTNLVQKKNVNGLQGQMKEHSIEELKLAIDYLLKHRLLFAENGSYMSLVFETEPFINLRGKQYS